MSFFKRLKEKLSGKTEEQIQQETVEESTEQNEVEDAGQVIEEEPAGTEKKLPLRKLNRMKK